MAVYQSTTDPYSSIVVSATTPSNPNPPVLTSVTAESDAAIALQWDDVDDESGYRIERLADGTWTSVGTVAANTTTFTDIGLTEATSYTYRVLATSTFGDSQPSATRNATTPAAAPADLVATAISGGRIDLSWTDHSATATTYYIEQSADGTTWTQVGSIASSTATTYSATGSFNGSTTYYFRVRTDSSVAGYSLYSSIISVTTPAYPSQPTLSSATAQSDTSVVLAWTGVPDATGYRVERSTNSGSTWTAVGTVADTVTTYNDTGLTEVTSYTYRVVATNAAGDSAPSITKTVATLPAAPSDLTATVVSGDQINLSWTNNSSAATAYLFERSTDSSNWTLIGATGAEATTYMAPGPFNASTTYYFQVRDYAPTGTFSDYVGVSVTTPAYPSQPTLTSTMAQSDTSVVLTWTGVSDATGYHVERTTNSGSTWTIVATVDSGVTTFTDTGLSEMQVYMYRVNATNSAGDS